MVIGFALWPIANNQMLRHGPYRLTKSFATAHSGQPNPALWPVAHIQILRYGPQRRSQYIFLLQDFILRSRLQRRTKSAAVAHSSQPNSPQWPIAHKKFTAVAHSAERPQKSSFSANSNLYSKLLQIRGLVGFFQRNHFRQKILRYCPFKRTVQRDFLTPVFSFNDVPWSQQTPRSDFEFRRIFVELFVFEIGKNRHSPLPMTTGSQKLSIRQPTLLPPSQF